MASDREGETHRYERKFVAEGASRQSVDTYILLNSARFSKIYEPRWVNNIYLDTLELESQAENVEGASERRTKVRIRWYGQVAGAVEKPVLELKIKNGLVNRKESYPLRPFVVDDTLCTRGIRQVFRESGLPRRLLQELLRLDITLMNRYRRSYARSADQLFRVTIDSMLLFHGLSPNRNTLGSRWFKSDNIVMELKYGIEHDLRAEKISQQFPFRLSRCSKYTTGLSLARVGAPLLSISACCPRSATSVGIFDSRMVAETPFVKDVSPS